MGTRAEPYRIKAVEPLHPPTYAERATAIEDAGYNTFLPRSRDCDIHLPTDSGTSAMSDRQWAALMMGDEAYAGAASFYRWGQAVRDIYGFRYVVPTHQGRGAEHLISRILIKPGQYVPGNMYFTTTGARQEMAGGHVVFLDARRLLARQAGAHGALGPRHAARRRRPQRRLGHIYPPRRSSSTSPVRQHAWRWASGHTGCVASAYGPPNRAM